MYCDLHRELLNQNKTITQNARTHARILANSNRIEQQIRCMYFHRMISHLQRSLLNFTSHIQSHYVRVTLLSSTFCSYYSTSSLVHIPFLTILVSLQFISTLTKPTKIESSTDVNNRHKIDETHGIFLICMLKGCRHKSYPLTHGTQRHYIFNGSSFFGRSLVFNYSRN